MFVGSGFAQDPTGGSLQRSPRSLAVFRGPTSKRKKDDGRGEEGKGRERRREGREGVRPLP